MATSTKNVRTKVHKKEEEKGIDPTEDQHAIVEGDVTPHKIKKPIEIDEPEPILGLDEKAEEDPLGVIAEEDELAEEVSLDGEELNPFGDRWEE